MANNRADWAVVLPGFDMSPWLKMMEQKRERDRERELEQRRYEDQLRRERNSQNNSMMQYLGSELRDKDFLTGTQFDRFFQDRISELKDKYFGLILNGSLDPVALHFLLQKETKDLGIASVKVRDFRKNLDEAIKSYSPKDGYMQPEIRASVLKDYVFDENGNFRTNFDELPEDPNTAIQSAINKNPTLVQENVVLNNMREFLNKNTNNVSDKIGRSAKGVSTKFVYNVDLLPSQEMAMDDKGNLLLNKNGLPYYKTKTKKGTDLDGNPVDELDDDVFDMLNSNPAFSTVLEGKFRNWQQFNPDRDIQPDSPEALKVKKSIAFGIVDQLPAKQFDTDRFTKISQPKSGTSDSDKFEKTSVATILRHAVDPSLMAGYPVIENSKKQKFRQLSGMVKNIYDEHGDTFKEILFDEQNKKFQFVPKDESAPIVEKSPEELPSYFSTVSGRNNVRPNDINTYWDNLTKGSGTSNSTNWADKFKKK